MNSQEDWLEVDTAPEQPWDGDAAKDVEGKDAEAKKVDPKDVDVKDVDAKDDEAKAAEAKAAEEKADQAKIVKGIMKIRYTPEYIRQQTTALYFAAQNGHKDIVQHLIRRGAPANQPAPDDWIPIGVAAANGHVDVVKLLLTQPNIYVNMTYAKNQTALYEAAQAGHTEIAQLLLNNGAEASLTRYNGYTPLHAAARNGHLKIVELLLKVDGIDLEAKNTSGAKALFGAAQNGHAKIVELLLLHGVEDINAVADDGTTALYAAAQKGHEETVQLLLNWRAEFKQVRWNKRTPADQAASNGHLKTLEVILRQYSLSDDT